MTDLLQLNRLQPGLAAAMQAQGDEKFTKLTNIFAGGLPHVASMLKVYLTTYPAI